MRHLQLVRVADGVTPTPDEADAEPWVEDTNDAERRYLNRRLTEVTTGRHP